LQGFIGRIYAEVYKPFGKSAALLFFSYMKSFNQVRRFPVELFYFLVAGVYFFYLCINYAVQNLRNNNPNEAVKCLKESLNIESKIKDLFEQMKGLAGDLRRLTKRDIKFLKKEKKRFS
jgi:hypothetical protein